jgi:UPF0755 protein
MKNKKILYIACGFVFLVLVVLVVIYRSIFSSSIVVGKNSQVILIPTGSSFEQVIDTLDAHVKINNRNTFLWLAGQKHYTSSIRPGRYVLTGSMSCNRLINLLRSGRQTPVKVTFNNVRTISQIAGKIGKQIEADSSVIAAFFSNESNYSGDGFNKADILALFIPDTYEFYWNTDAHGLYSRFLREYRAFWNDERIGKAKEKNLKPAEVSVLASIIDNEVSKKDEKPRIAGVYMNRLRMGIPLQSDPTIMFALDDFTISRVLKKDLLVDSPYNTYLHTGLPPGPIGCASVDGIDAVLNAEKNDYIFFVAKSDFSGYHNFSRTLAEHNRYASLYQRELNKRKIYR